MSFRVRRSGERFWVWQQETRKTWVRVEQPFPSRGDACAWIAARS